MLLRTLNMAVAPHLHHNHCNLTDVGFAVAPCRRAMKAATGKPGQAWPAFSSSSNDAGSGVGGKGTESIMLLDVASNGGVRPVQNFRSKLCDIWDGVPTEQTPIE